MTDPKPTRWFWSGRKMIRATTTTQDHPQSPLYVLASEHEAEIDRLTKERDDAREYGGIVRIRERAADDARIRAEADAAEARALVKYMEGFDRCTCGPCPIHPEAALEAYGREKVREGMKRAYDVSGQYHQVTHIRAAILAEMETLK